MTEGTLARCVVCGAMLKPRQVYCSKCGSRGSSEIVATETTTDGSPTGVPDVTAGSASFSLATLMIVVTMIAILMALFVAAPGLAILVAFCLLPPAIRTLLISNKRKSLGRVDSPLAKTGLFLSSLGVTILILVVLQVACVIAFFGSCFAIFALSATPSSIPIGSSMWIAATFTIAAFIFLVWRFSKWIRSRWQRDLDRPPLR